MKCPNCGHNIHTGGRKRYNVSVAMVCNALQHNNKGGIAWQKTADKINEENGLNVSRGFVMKRYKEVGGHP